MSSDFKDIPITNIEAEVMGPGKYRVHTSVADLAETLLYRWPIPKGRALLRARQACLEALEGGASPEEARQCFLKAALEAGVTLREASKRKSR